jgi:hypothetical protein
MCFGGGSSSATIDPEIEAQQEADKKAAQAETTAQKEAALNQAVATNKPLVSGDTPSVDKASDMDASLKKRSAGTVIRKRRKSGRGSLFTGQGGGIGFYSKYK